MRLIETKDLYHFILSYLIIIISIISIFSLLYLQNSSNFQNSDNQNIKINLLDAFYFSAMTFTTVGFGDISPQGINKMLSIIQSILALSINIAFIGYILSSKRAK